MSNMPESTVRQPPALLVSRSGSGCRATLAGVRFRLFDFSTFRLSRAAACRVLLLGLVVGTGGCSGSSWFSNVKFRPLFKPEGEPWTIQCLAVSGAARQQTADSVADVLRQTATINAREVRVEHGPAESFVYYGQYYRRLDERTRRLEVTEQMNRDMRLVKELGVPGQGHYFADAKFVPTPTPDVGDPAWALARSTAVYTLRVAVFANEPGFYERKQAAAEYAAALRGKGYPAFYHHGAIHSEVYVGEFGEDAVEPLAAREAVPDKSSGGGYRQEVVSYEKPSAEVRALQAKETFAYELWNLRKRGERVGSKMLYTASRVVRVRETLASDER